MIVPTTSGTTPNCPSRNSGVHVVPVRNSHGLTSPKNSIAGRSNERTMPSVVSTEIAAATKRIARTSCSPQRIRFRGSATAGCPTTASCDATSLGFLELRLLLGQLRLAQRHELCGLGNRLVRVEHEPDEVADVLVLVERALLDVHEERARERRVRAVLRRLDARGDAAPAAVDLERLERVLVLLEVREAEVAERRRARRKLPGR